MNKLIGYILIGLTILIIAPVIIETQKGLGVRTMLLSITTIFGLWLIGKIISWFIHSANRSQDRRFWR